MNEITTNWNYGYVCGGYDDSTCLPTIDRFHFPFNSGAASHVGDLSTNKANLSANNSSQHGYVCGGGYYCADSWNYYYYSAIDRFQFPFGSGTASHVGNLSVSRFSPAANNSSQHGYVCGGWSGSTLPSTIDRFQFPFDSGTATYAGDLGVGKWSLAANNSSQHGYVCGGWISDIDTYLSIIDRFQFPFDSGTADHVGDLSGTKHVIVANNSSQYGYVCAGYNGSCLSTIDRFQFPFDSGTASHVGNLSGSRHDLAANNSSQHGYACGGWDVSSYFSTIDRFQFPFDSGTASHVGNLKGSKAELASTDTTDFIQMFI